MLHTLIVLAENEPGVLARMSRLFARRGYNILSLAVGATEIPNNSRITLVLSSREQSIEQVIKQLYSMVAVLKVEDITLVPSVEREVILIKVETSSSVDRNEIIDIANIFRAKIVDCAENALMLEVCGDPGRVAAIKKMLKKFNITELTGAGRIALTRESYVNSESIKNEVKDPEKLRELIKLSRWEQRESNPHDLL